MKKPQNDEDWAVIMQINNNLTSKHEFGLRPGFLYI